MGGYLLLGAALLVDRVGFGLLPGWEMFRPDLVLVVLVWLAMTKGKPHGPLLGAWGSGLLIDLTSWSPLGVWAVAQSLPVLAIFYLRERFNTTKVLVRVGAVLAAGLLRYLLLLLVNLGVPMPLTDVWTLLSQLAASMAVALLLPRE
ncbi:rod shape-determining protein MreD [bacterium]|nr:rod shape-determining protein MreD [bacterium]